MSAELDSVEDLIARARRGLLSEAELRRLREHLAGSSAARILYEHGRAFDREAPVRAGDELRLERMIAAVQKGYGKRQRARVRPRLVLGIVAAVLATTAAVAAVRVLSPSAESADPVPRDTSLAGSEEIREIRGAETDGASSPEAPDGSVDAGERSAGAPPPGAQQHRGGARPKSVTDPGEVPRESSIAPRAPAHEPSAAAKLDASIARFGDVPEQAQAPTAVGLFAAANQARLRGDTQWAIALYQQLKATFPRAPETPTASLSLGLLYLQNGRPALALTELRACRGLGLGSRRVDALWGEAQALQRLGRTDEEQRVLSELLERYPDSVYADAARKRLSGAE